MKYFITTFLILVSSSIFSQSFDEYFENNTLRLDYTFIGTSKSESIALDKLNKIEHWAGRRHNLSELARDGNGQITVYDKKSNNIIYKDAFSSLFQEWQSTPEAETVTRSFENVYLVPFPKEEVKIEVSFRMQDGSYKTLLSHDVNPNDILIRKLPSKNPYTAIHEGGSIEDCINIAIVPEGYTTGEMNKFKKHAEATVKEILKHKPFGKFKNKLNFYTLDVSSQDSEVSIPRQNIWKNTLVGSHFDTFYSDRYLTTSNVKDLHDALAGVPYSHIIILANTETYGGGGIFNSYTLTTTGHPSFAPVVVHEFGHSFGGLADEYYYKGGDIFDTMYSLDVEPWEPNITTLVDFKSKWESILKPNTPNPTPEKDTKKFPVGIYEGGGYVSKGIYRPAADCRMKTNTCKEFCPACQRAIEQIIRYYTE